MCRGIAITLVILGIGLLSCIKDAPILVVKDANYDLLPLPVKITQQEGGFPITTRTEIFAVARDSSLKPVLGYFRELIQELTGYELSTRTISSSQQKKGVIYFFLDSQIPQEEGYKLSVSPNKIVIRGKTPQGIFYGLQSLRQLFQINVKKDNVTGQVGYQFFIPSVEIEDSPRFSYRGMHLDVSRHFFSVDFIKKYIDLLAYHKMNYFHWHLTDDQGWRIEIKRYPKLTETGAYRSETLVGHYSDVPVKYDGKRYGGYYSQDEIKSIVKYAQERFVTIIPEIEMPGHALAALAAYPELACTDGPFKTATTWGIFDDVFCPEEETFTFLEGVLDEVISLFPGKYIHIGGDECPTTRWKESKFCKELMRREGIKTETALQGYFINRIARYVQSKGRSVIGWDEILETGVDNSATIMSWRGTQGGIDAAINGHEVIMTPTSHLYFDYYQADPTMEPLAIGGMLPLRKVYEYEPIPDELSDNEAEYILGAQGNIWTEYLQSPEKLEYMMFPRAAALAELLWTEKNQKDWDSFTSRLESHLERLRLMQVNYAMHVFDVEATVKPDSITHALTLKLGTMTQQTDIYFTLDDSNPTAESPGYTEPIQIYATSTLKAALIKEGKRLGNITKQTYHIHKAIGHIPQLKNPPGEKYKAGPYVITDGIRGTKFFNDLYYGFDGTDFETVIDLGIEQDIQKITLGFLHTTYAYIFLPTEVSFLVSQDGTSYKEVYRKSDPSATQEATPVGKKDHSQTLNDTRARFVKVIAKNTTIPRWHSGKGKPSWLFVDEMMVE